METTHKLGPFEVILDGTCSAACPFIVPKGEEFEEAVAELPAVFTAIGFNATAETYRENPAIFEKKDCHDKVMAIAHLFAAAPDILEALEKLMKSFHFLPCSPSELCPDEWEQAEAAIAKAKGVQS